MRYFLVLLLAIRCFGENYCVGVAPVSVTCTGSVFANSNAQAALDSVSTSGGDTVYLQAGYRYPELQFRVHGLAVTPNVVTSSAYPFLPCETCRVGMEYRGVLPIIASTTINVPSLQGNLDSANPIQPGSGRPPQGWTFIGLQIEIAAQAGGFSQQPAFLTGGLGDLFTITGPSLLPNAITVDRCLFPQPFGDTVQTTNVLWINGTNITVKNSYIYPPYYAVGEGHSIYCDTCPGPQTVVNNTVGTSTIPIFTGGTEPEYNNFDGSVGMHNAVHRYNYIYRPLKYWVNTYGGNTTANPRPDWFFANGSHSICHKNLGEFKTINGGLVELNVFANNWKDDYCNGQWYGITAVFRQTYYPSPELAATYGYGNTVGNELLLNIHVSDSAGQSIDSSTSVIAGYYLPIGITSGAGGQNPTNGGLSLSPAQYLPSVARGGRVNVPITATGGTRPYTYSCTNCPGWLTINAATGVLSGTVPSNFGVHMTAGGSTLSWDGLAGLQAGMGFCGVVLTPTFVIDCHKISSVDNNAKTASIGGTWAYGGDPMLLWYVATDPTSTSQNLTYQNNVYRAIAGGLNLQVRDSVPLPPNEDPAHPQFGRMNHFRLRNNLFDNSIWAPNLGFDPAATIVPMGNEMFSSTGCAGGRNGYLNGGDIVYDHNTFRAGNNKQGSNGQGLSLNDGNVSGSSCTSPVNGVAVTNNIFPMVDPGYGIAMYGAVPYWTSLNGGENTGFNNWAMLDNIATGRVVAANNYFPVVNSRGCVNTVCVDNQSTNAPAAFRPNTNKVETSSLLRAASDAADVGVNEGLLPQFKNLHVTASAHTALLEADLSAPIVDAAGNQPCMLEVSSAKVTANGYTVTCQDSQVCDPAPGGVKDLNPNSFKGAPATNRANPLLLTPVVSGGHLYFPIGQEATVTGDDGAAHDLRLAPSTDFAGTLSCYGDSQTFTFRTLESASGTTSLAMQVAPPPGVATVEVAYGPTSATTASVTRSVTAGTALLWIPVSPGTPVYSRITYKDDRGAVVYGGPLRVKLP